MSEALQSYFREAASWEMDRAAQAIRRARVAWSMAVAGWVCAVLIAVCLALLMPLKTVEPYVIRVDNATGIVDIVPMYAGHAEIGETVARYLLTHYVSVCEGFNVASAERDYQECGSYNSVKRNQEWYAQWVVGNPSSPLNLYKDGTTVRVQVTAVTFFKRANGQTSLAQVRYLKAKRAPGASEQLSHWIATLDYGYAPPSRIASYRQWNPLGFRVTSFQTQAESTADTSVLPAP